MREECKKVKKKRSVKKIIFTVLFIIIALLVGLGFFVTNNVNPVIVNLANEKIKAITTDAVNNAVIEVMRDHTDTDYLSIERAVDNSIKSVEIDSYYVNGLAQEITIASQKMINAAGQDGINIPIGSLTGITLFTGLGPNINIKVYLVGSTKTRIISEFSQSGINQTRHRLYLDITGSVSVAVPGLPSSIDTATQVLMSEMIIIGEVPPTYLNSSNLGDMLDLVAG